MHAAAVRRPPFPYRGRRRPTPPRRRRRPTAVKRSIVAQLALVDTLRRVEVFDLRRQLHLLFGRIKLGDGARCRTFRPSDRLPSSRDTLLPMGRDGSHAGDNHTSFHFISYLLILHGHAAVHAQHLARSHSRPRPLAKKAAAAGDILRPAQSVSSGMAASSGVPDGLGQQRRSYRFQ